MEAIIQSPSEFSKLIGLVASFDATFNMKCSKKGIHIFCMDGARSSIVQVHLTVDWFNSYVFTYTESDELELGIHVDLILKALKSAQKNDILTISKKDGDKLNIILSGADRQLQFEVKLINIEDEVLEIPDVEYNFQINLSSKYIKNWKKDIVDNTGNHIDFTPMKDKLQLKSQSSDTTITSTVLPNEKLTYTVFNEPLSMGLGPGPLNIASKIGDLSDTCDFGWMNGAPINVKAQLNEGSTVSMWFAPVLGDEDEEMDDA